MPAGWARSYRAVDTRLNRQVAIKVLPEPYASDTERVSRFHREAQAIAALNHVSIAAIYDFAQADGIHYLVLELIEGETLADRIRRGPIPVDEALDIARQILEALEMARLPCRACPRSIREPHMTGDDFRPWFEELSQRVPVP